MGFSTKEKFSGQVIVESVDGRTFSESFGGRINNTKPEVQITKSGGGPFSRAKFQVQVTGEFDKVEVTGSNIKPQTFKYDSTQTRKEFNIKTLSRAEASISVKASLKTKVARVPVLDGETLSTNGSGRIQDEESRLFSTPWEEILEVELKETELGFCCEEVGELSCKGCYAGKRSRKSCKALNKLPGYDFKAIRRHEGRQCRVVGDQCIPGRMGED